MPENTVAVSFLMKPLYGPPPVALALGEVERRYAAPVVTGSCSLKIKGNDWQKITIPLDQLQINRKEMRNLKFVAKPGTLYLFTLYGAVSDQPSAFLLDDLAWELE